MEVERLNFAATKFWQEPKEELQVQVSDTTMFNRITEAGHLNKLF